MAKRYVNVKENFSSFEEFKEVATKTLNEIFGRGKPFDLFDYSYDDNGTYTAVGYYEGEEPAEIEEGTPLPEEAVAEIEKTEVVSNDEVEEIKALKERIDAAATEETELSYADLKRGAELGLFTEGPHEGAKVYTLAQILGASDQAIELAEELNVDIRLIEGTGKAGNVGVADVREYVKANPAPAKENADDNGVDDSQNA